MGWLPNKRAFATPEENAAPPDVGNAAYIVFFSLGAGFLLPWNSFIIAVDYFEYLYPNQHIDRVFSVSYIFPCLIVLCFLTFYGKKKFTSRVRINSGLVLYLLCVVLVPILDAIFIKGDKRGSVGTYYFTVGALVVTGIADALVQGSIVGAAGELPERYMQAVVNGTAASGVLVAALRIITKAALPQTRSGLRISGNVYFGVTAVFLGFCFVAFNVVHKLPVIQYYQTQKLQRLMRAETEPLQKLERLKLERAETEPLINSSRGDLEGEVNVPNNQELASSAVGSSTGTDTVDIDDFKHVLRKVKWLAGSLSLVCVVTLSIFPGFLAEDVTSALLADWYPVVLMSVFNVFDMVGKKLTELYIPDNRVMIAGSVGRLLFIPLYAACLHGPRLFRTEVPVSFLSSLFGLTNGYLTSCLLIVGPKTVYITQAETAGILLTLWLVGGSAIGSAVSWVWVV